jgi:predicted DsbA family dithiol-disulfide isomerase
MPNTARAHRLLRRVAGSGDRVLHEALLERLFGAYFQQGRDLGDAATLHALALEAGVPAALAVACDDDTQPLPIGAPVSGVPYFAFDGHLTLAGARDATTLFESMHQAVRVRGLVAA